MATETPLHRSGNIGKGTSKCFPAPHSIPAWTTGSPADRSSSRAPCSRPRHKSAVCLEVSFPRWRPRFDLWHTFWNFCLFLHYFSFCRYYRRYCCSTRTSTKSIATLFYILSGFFLKIALLSLSFPFQDDFVYNLLTILLNCSTVTIMIILFC